MNLLERVTKDSCSFNIDLLLRGIRKGIQHLYSLNLIYCNLNPTSILIDKDTPVIGDFDSCRYNKEKLSFKAKTKGQTSKDFKFAKPENNKYKLSKIRDFLFQSYKM